MISRRACSASRRVLKRGRPFVWGITSRQFISEIERGTYPATQSITWGFRQPISPHYIRITPESRSWITFGCDRETKSSSPVGVPDRTLLAPEP
jgi:hypothetical protein